MQLLFIIIIGLIVILFAAIGFLFMNNGSSSKKQFELEKENNNIKQEIVNAIVKIKDSESGLNKTIDKKISDLDNESTKKQDQIHKTQQEQLLITLKTQQEELTKKQKSLMESSNAEILKLQQDILKTELNKSNSAFSAQINEQVNNLQNYQNENKKYHKTFEEQLSQKDEEIKQQIKKLTSDINIIDNTLKKKEKDAVQINEQVGDYKGDLDLRRRTTITKR
jgi:hypothetical protein